MKFPLTETHLQEVVKAEETALGEINEAIAANPDDIAAVIIEPIQSEGGDNHFRKEFLLKLREICDEMEMLLIFDEVQTGVGLTGKMWAHEYFVRPDLMTFGKKSHVCGFMSSTRIDDIDDNVFHKTSRLNSTFGGNLVDMFRFKRIMEVIAEEDLVEKARAKGERMLESLLAISKEFPDLVSNVRGRGMMCAVDLENTAKRDRLRRLAYDQRLIIIGCGERSIRFRPPLTILESELDEGFAILRNALLKLTSAAT